MQTHEIKSSIYVVESTLTWATCKVNFRIHSDQWASNLTDTQILQVCEGAPTHTALVQKECC